METLWNTLSQWLDAERTQNLVLGGVTLVVGLILATWLKRGVGRLLPKRLSAQETMVATRVVHYLALTLVVIVSLHQAGLDLSILLGAAGILTVAFGFAAQTSASNIISGLFLMGESPFKIGDAIRIGTTTGEVVSIDLLSVRLRTFDNLLVRLPNETLLKSEITNLTRYPIRRADLLVGVAYKEDVDRVEEILMTVARRNPLCLDEPKPMLVFLRFGESSLDLRFSCWAAQSNFLELKTSMNKDIHRAFDDAGIEIPFPQRSLNAGAGTEAFPIRRVEPGGAS